MVKGTFPFESSWLIGTSILNKKFCFEDRDQSLKTVMENWFFSVQTGTGTFLISGNGVIDFTGIKKTSTSLVLSGNGSFITVNVKGALGSPLFTGDGDILMTGMKDAFENPVILGKGNLIFDGIKKTFMNMLISGNGDIIFDWESQGGESKIITRRRNPLKITFL